MRHKKLLIVLFQLSSVTMCYGNNIEDILKIVRKKPEPVKTEFVGNVKSITEVRLSKNDTVSSTYREYDEYGKQILEKRYGKGGALIQKVQVNRRADSTVVESFIYSDELFGCYRTISVSIDKKGVVLNECYDKNDSLLSYTHIDFDKFGNIISNKSEHRNTYYKNKYDYKDRLVETKVYLGTDSLTSTTTYSYDDKFRTRIDSNAHKLTYSKFIIDKNPPLLVEFKTTSNYDEYTSFKLDANYEWDANNRLVAFSGFVNDQFCKGNCYYDKHNRMTKVVAYDSVGNKSIATFKYDKAGRVVEESFNSREPRYNYSKVMKYDKQNRFILEQVNNDGTWSVERFEYDDKKLTMVNRAGDIKNMVVKYQYTMDKKGNWITKWNNDSKKYIRTITYYK